MKHQHETSMKKIIFFLGFFIILSSQAEISKNTNSNSRNVINKQTISELTNTLQAVNFFGTQRAGQASDCNCAPKNQTQIIDILKSSLAAHLTQRQGKGISVGVDAHAGPIGENFSYDIIQFGGFFDSLINSRKVKYALYCSGGVSAATDIAASVGISGVKTFGKCDSPQSYSGGSIMLGIQGDAGIGSIGGTLNLGFNMKDFGDFFERDFPTSLERTEMKKELLQMLAFARTKSGEKNFLLIKLLGSLFYPGKVPALTKAELDYLIQIQKDKNKEMIPQLYSDFKSFMDKQAKAICKSSSECLKGKFEKATQLTGIFAEAFDDCHAISVGLSVGPSIGLPVNISVGYNDYVLISSIDLNLKKAGSALATVFAQETANMWQSFLSTCSTKDPKITQVGRNISTARSELNEALYAQFNPETLQNACAKSLLNANRQTLKVLKNITQE